MTQEVPGSNPKGLQKTKTQSFALSLLKNIFWPSCSTVFYTRANISQNVIMTTMGQQVWTNLSLFIDIADILSKKVIQY